ncbi:MAG: SynChlorMet cassette protein ScmC [Desulfomonilaceae bacterium]|nr:SynChlorMet cassette protein ScmC [Desulfomonilaceae bacterium]
MPCRDRVRGKGPIVEISVGVREVIVAHHQYIGYDLKPAGELSWTFRASSSAASWLEKLALIMQLVPAVRNAPRVIYCAKTNRRWDRRMSPVHLLNTFDASHIPRVGWTREDFGSVRLWHHQEIPDVLCELESARHYAGEVLQMWYSMQAVYPGLAKGGGLPLHCALIEREWTGVLLVAGGGHGKSTCCRRLPQPWNALSDDLALVIPGGEGTFFGHPLPTWSDHMDGRWAATWNVKRGAPLRGVFFLEQANHDKAIPMGQGQAAIALARSASYVTTRDGLRRDRAREMRKMFFGNATLLARSVPSFTLRVNLNGSFWNEVEHALDGRR